MLPTNSSKAHNWGCDPVSSNCVVWQGPDLECIDLCKGDTISDVVAKLAEELCIIIEQFNLENYDFSCLQVSVSERPEKLQELIQILINKICALEGIDLGTGADGSNDCPDNCVVPIATCFYFENETGDTVTTMPLLNYVTAIGNSICDILDDIQTLQDQVTSLQNQINTTNGEVDVIAANYVPQSSLDYQNSTKIDPTGSTKYVTDALRTVENFLINTQESLGNTTEVFQNIVKAGNITNEDALSENTKMSALIGWTAAVQNVAQSIGNAWIAINDIRESVNYIKDNCCKTGCQDLFLNFQTQIVGSNLTVYTTGSTGFTREWRECTPEGTLITVKDSANNSTTFRSNLIAIIDVPTGETFSLVGTSVDPALDLTITAETCFYNSSNEITCDKVVEDKIFASGDCPTITLQTFVNSVQYSFTTAIGYAYRAEVKNDLGSIVATQIISNPGAIVTNIISGLLADTDYTFELTSINGGGVETVCPTVAFTTLAEPCLPPDSVVAVLTT